MIYCGIGEDSDIYVYGSDEFLECFGCLEVFKTKSYSEMINHLKKHAELYEDKVPNDAFERLKKERDEIGDIYNCKIYKFSDRIKYFK